MEENSPYSSNRNRGGYGQAQKQPSYSNYSTKNSYQNDSYNR